MADLAQSEARPEVFSEAPSPLDDRVVAYRLRLAGTLRSLSAVSAAAAALLETGGPITETVGLLQTLERLQAQAGADATCLGAVLGSCGSA